MLVSIQVAHSQIKAISDTIDVTGKAVVFFGVTQREYDSLLVDKNSGIDAAWDDFTYYADKLMPYLDSLKIETAVISSPIVRIWVKGDNPRVYHTKKLDDILGIIMTDGAQQPQILLGVTTDDDWKDNIRKYFGIH
jgi:hypothetical protein